MASVAELVLILTAKDHASKEFQSAADKFKAVGQKMQTIGAAMSVAVTAPFVLFAKSAVESASSTEESLNKVRVVFRESAKDIEAFAASAATNLGVSNQKALEAAGTFGNLFTAMGIGRPVAADMSKTILTLAADLASFNDLDPTEVLEKLRAGLVGEVEPLRTLGVNLNAGRIAAEALRLELVKGVQDDTKVQASRLAVEKATIKWTEAVKKSGQGSIEAREAGITLTKAEEALEKAVQGTVPPLNASQKAMAALSLITQDTKNAAGDFKNTSDSLANSQRQATAQFENLSAEMGKMLLPLMLEGVKLLKGLMEGFMNLSPEVRKGILIVVGLIAVLGPLLALFGTLLTVLPAVGAAIAILTGPIGIIIAALALLAYAWATDWNGMRAVIERVVDALVGTFLGFSLFMVKVWNGILAIVQFVINQLVGRINFFIDIWNALAERLGLPQIGRIEVVLPNLNAVEQALNNAARNRTSSLFVNVYEQAIMGGGGTRMFQHGTPSVPYTQVALVHKGERIIPADQNRPGAWGSPIVNITVQGSLIGFGVDDLAEKIAAIFTKQRRIAGLA